MKFIIPIFLLLSAINVIAQHKNMGETPQNQNCESYVFNPKKLKVKVNSNYARFQLNDVKVDVPQALMMRKTGCENELEVIMESGDLSSQIKSVVESSYPDVNSLKMNLHIKDIRLLDNRLPTSNKRLYVTIDFYLQVQEDEYALKYSVTEFTNITNYIERPLGKLIKGVIEDFSKTGLINSYKQVDENEDADVIYTSFDDLFKMNATYRFEHQLDSVFSGKLKAKYVVTDGVEGNGVNKPILGLKYDGKQYLNINYYYPKYYFVELVPINHEYYFIFDHIYDYTKATNTAMVTGGGLVGGVIASAISNTKSPGLINAKSGRLIALTRKKLRNALGEDYKLYQDFVNQEDTGSIIGLLINALNNESSKEILLDIPYSDDIDIDTDE